MGVLPDGAVVHLRAAGVSLVVDTAGPRLPRIAHWGADLGELPQEQLAEVVRSGVRPLVPNGLDEVVPLSVVAEPAAGWPGTPGVSGHRAGAGFAPLFTVSDVALRGSPGDPGRALLVRADDPALELVLDLVVELTADGLVRLRAVLTNAAEHGDYTLDQLVLSVPVPTEAQEVLDFTGRWSRERSPQRHALTQGTHAREGRRGRTGADATLLLAAGEPGFGFRGGRVWAVHTAWSGNHLTQAERTPAGDGVLSGGELLLPGEVVLAPGESYTTPWLVASSGRGLDEVSARFHRYLRGRPQHPASARKVTLNTWEAVYFDHDLDKLTRLAEIAADVGAERFVLDDGWFRHRRHDRAGLGDWYVDEDVWPQGLHELVRRVRGLGMDFGLWVEPEMISVDSDAAREHPGWIMSSGSRLPPESRHQQVLDLSEPAAFDHVLERLDSLVTEYGIDYLKWDHNRDLVDAGHPRTGRAGVHDQTLATYRLIDVLKERHPGLEVESCSSGGARADLGILERTDRVWGSDCIDPLERQHIQRWTGLLLPPEMIGSHVGAPTSHTTGRTHALDFRAGTALFGHFGIEWDLTRADEQELRELAAWVGAYKELRPLVHTGAVVRSDHRDPAHWVHGVVADDASEAVFALVAVATGAWSPPGRVRLPGLDPAALYDVVPLSPVARPEGRRRLLVPGWWARGVRASGTVLGEVGIQAPVQDPDQLQLLRVTRVDPDRSAAGREEPS